MAKKKNPDGRKNKGKEKVNKGDKQIAAIETPKAKVVKPKGPAADYKHPKVKAEVVQTDLNVLWNGWSGLVEHAGMQFRATKIKDGKREYQVHVVSAPQGTELYGLGGSSIYVTVQSLHSPKFHSTLKVGSIARSRQERIWKCLDKALREQGIKVAHVHSASKAAANKAATVLQSILKPQGAIGEGVAVPREYRLPKAA